MAHRLVGEFRPPPELVAVSAARVSGRGALETTPTGLRVDGRVLVDVPAVPRAALSVGALAFVLVGGFVPGSEAILLPATFVVAAGLGWRYFRAEFGQARVVEVPWDQVEHVVRLGSAKDVVAIVLSRPLGGAGSPETLYFAPSLGVEAVAAALKEAPPHVTIDLDSGMADAQGEPEE